MNIDSQELDCFRFAFNSLSRGTPCDLNPSICCQAGQIWQAAGGELSFRETRRIVDHLAQCPHCAQSWRMAREIQLEMDGTLGGGPTSWFPRRLLRPAAAWATAATVVLAAGLLLVEPFDSPLPPQMRGNEQSALRSLISEEDPLPRHQYRLNWVLQDAEPGVLYHLQVMTLDFETVVSVTNLTNPDYTIPSDRLAHLPSGTTLIWQVEAVREDGSRTANQFLSRLQ